MDQNELKKAILWAEKEAKLREDMARETMGDLHEQVQGEAGRYRIAAGCMWAMLEQMEALKDDDRTGD